MMRRVLFAGLLLLALAWASDSQEVSFEGIVCPGSNSVCPTDSTCCQISKDEWGCCPVPDAVCCGDGKHCCGKGQKCTDGRCTSSLLSTPWLMKSKAKLIKSKAKPMKPKETMPWLNKTLALQVDVGIVQCDATHYCPSGNTCCKLASGQWGCCPVPNAVCCDDHQHCCPSGYTCQTGTGECTR